MSKKQSIIGECGDCGHPIYKSGKHNPQCIKPSEKRELVSDHIRLDDGEALIDHGGRWVPYE